MNWSIFVEGSDSLLAEERTRMIEELKKWVVPELNNIGFKGSFPHYRRIKQNRVDLLMFQFDKWGGGFLIEISYVLLDGDENKLCIEKNNTPFEKLTVSCTNLRHRLYPDRFDGWFYYYDVAEVKSNGVKFLVPVKPADRQSFIDNTKGKISWLQIVDESIYEQLANEVLGKFDEAEKWWLSMPQEKCLSRQRKKLKILFRK